MSPIEVYSSGWRSFAVDDFHLHRVPNRRHKKIPTVSTITHSKCVPTGGLLNILRETCVSFRETRYYISNTDWIRNWPQSRTKWYCRLGWGRMFVRLDRLDGIMMGVLIRMIELLQKQSLRIECWAMEASWKNWESLILLTKSLESLETIMQTSVWMGC